MGLGRALEAYEAIYARSWKEPEPFPAFNATVLPLLAGAGVLRMGVMWLGGGAGGGAVLDGAGRGRDGAEAGL